MSAKELVEQALVLMVGRPFRASSLAGMIRGSGNAVTDRSVSAILGGMVRSGRIEKLHRGLHKGYYLFDGSL